MQQPDKKPVRATCTPANKVNFFKSPDPYFFGKAIQEPDGSRHTKNPMKYSFVDGRFVQLISPGRDIISSNLARIAPKDPS